MGNGLEKQDEPPDMEGQREVVGDKANRHGSGSDINAVGFLCGVSLRQGANVRLCGFDGAAYRILHDWGINNVVGMGAD